jgi:hypothetical protein
LTIAPEISKITTKKENKQSRHVDKGKCLLSASLLPMVFFILNKKIPKAIDMGI